MFYFRLIWNSGGRPQCGKRLIVEANSSQEANAKLLAIIDTWPEDDPRHLGRVLHGPFPDHKTADDEVV